MKFEEEEISILFNKFADESKDKELKLFYTQLKKSIDFSEKDKLFHFDSFLLNKHRDINDHLNSVSKSLKVKSYYLTKAITLEDWRESNTNSQHSNSEFFIQNDQLFNIGLFLEFAY